jgi:hypothetical protein
MPDAVLVSTRKGLFTIGGSRRVDRVSFLAYNVSLAMRDPRDGALYAALDHGHFGPKLHRSADDGATWTEITAPAFPPKPEGLEDLDPMRRTPIPWTVQRIWALEPGHAARPGELWCGTIPGGLFRSPDGGMTWELVRPLWDHPDRRQWFGGGADYPGIHSICVDPRDGARLLVGVSCGGVWETRDGGRTWSCRAQGMRAAYMPPERAMDPRIQDPHMVVRCPGSPDALWAQHHNGIFRTTDGAASWSEVRGDAPSWFGFGVAVHPTDPDTAWFVPGVSDERRIPPSGELVVTRTRDGGRTFETLRRGLPQAHAYDIVFRHALAVDRSGRALVFGTTTGSLYRSDDGGEQWTALSEHLPPVYAVRFC